MDDLSTATYAETGIHPNQAGAERARPVMAAYLGHAADAQNMDETTVADVITDLLHLAASYDLHADVILDRVRRDLDAETGDPDDGVTVTRHGDGTRVVEVDDRANYGILTPTDSEAAPWTWSVASGQRGDAATEDKAIAACAEAIRAH